MKEHELPHWNKKPIAVNYHDRTESQKRHADEERYEYEARHKSGLKDDE